MMTMPLGILLTLDYLLCAYIQYTHICMLAHARARAHTHTHTLYTLYMITITGWSLQISDARRWQFSLVFNYTVGFSSPPPSPLLSILLFRVSSPLSLLHPRAMLTGLSFGTNNVCFTFPIFYSLWLCLVSLCHPWLAPPALGLLLTLTSTLPPNPPLTLLVCQRFGPQAQMTLLTAVSILIWKTRLVPPNMDHIHTHHTRAYIHTYIHTPIHTCIHTYIHTHIHTYIHTYMHTYIHTHLKRNQ
jgi:hypothetical protein